MEKTKICLISQIEDNQISTFTINDQPIMVFKKDDKYHVMNGSCPHQGAVFSNKDLKENCILQCPWHHAQFDLLTGQTLQGPQMTKMGFINTAIKMVLPKLTTYESIVEGDTLYVKGTIDKQKHLVKN